MCVGAFLTLWDDVAMASLLACTKKPFARGSKLANGSYLSFASAIAAQTKP